MVVACVKTRKKSRGVATIDLSLKKEHKSTLTNLIVEACQDYGIFKIVNHGVPHQTVSGLEKQCLDFFATPHPDKHRVGPANPFGYGCRSIGSNGDMGELEYLILHATNSSTHPPTLRNTVVDYAGAVKALACEILDMIAEGMHLSDKLVFSKMIKDVHSDSLLRLNHYPPLKDATRSLFSTTAAATTTTTEERIGFGEHSDPQILTILGSNDVEGLQIRMADGFWLPVQPDPTAFYVMVGDALQVMTNGRLRSVKHRAMANKSASKGRLSIMYFGAPPLNALICPVKELVSSLTPSLYTPFTWAQYKAAMRNSRLGDCRLNLFKKPMH